MGAGVSIDSGAPVAQTLSDELGKEFLGEGSPSYPLAEVADLIDAEIGRRQLNEYLVERFEGLVPAGALEVLPSFCWQAIYTVNFDTLVEQAYASHPEPVQKLRPLYSDKDQISRLKPNEVPLYKLHGCLSRANADDGHLVLTQEDFARVSESRQRLFNRLIDSVADFPILYVGFRRGDPDFAQVIVSVEQAVKTLTSLPRSYALQPGFSEPEEKRAELKKVTLVDAKASDFFGELLQQIPKDERRCPEEDGDHKARSILAARRPNVRPDLVEALTTDYEILDDAIATSEPDPEAFFAGSAPSWGTIAAEIDARRDIEDALLETLLVDTQLDRSSEQFFLLHAEAGSGKTTLLRRLGFELVSTWDRVVVSLKPFGDLEFLDLERLASAVSERIYVLIDDVAASLPELDRALERARRAKAKITFLGAARTNEWRDAEQGVDLSAHREFEIENLSSNEIDLVLDTLEANDQLGYLETADRPGQRQAFESRAKKQLLVALKEATEGKDFDEIVVNEFHGIPSADARRAYLFVAALHRFGLVTRAGVLHRALGVPLADLGSRVFRPATKILIAVETQGDPEPYYETRHPLIAEIVFDRQVTGEEQRLDFYRSLIHHLDLGYASDAETYRRLSRSLNRRLLKDFQRISSKRTLMDEVTRLDPTDAFVHQHAAMMELSARNLDRATTHIAQAIELRPDDPAIRDTQGRIILAAARAEEDRRRKLAKLTEAEAIFSRNMSRRPQEPFGYRHLAESYWEHSLAEQHEQARLKYLELAYRTLLDGLDRCANSTMLHQYQAELEEQLGHRAEARVALSRALAERPDDVTVRLMAARLAPPDEARTLLQAGVERSPDAWELHYHLALNLAELGSADSQAIGQHFTASLLAPLRRYGPRLAYGAWLFSEGEYESAAEQFERLGQLEVRPRERYEPRRFTFGHLGSEQEGRVTRLSMASGDVEYDRGATRVFFHLRDLTSDVRGEVRIHSQLRYVVRFNLLGPIATGIRLTRQH